MTILSKTILMRCPVVEKYHMIIFEGLPPSKEDMVFKKELESVMLCADYGVSFFLFFAMLEIL
ncbi:unnamed protein product [Meloidogyne enterolobii]|uniref:Uncharacterized protein n=1 Tax=Meloidogyne enterolobii TaxID=390850 RepID=A0ACB0ZR37_MELEN